MTLTTESSTLASPTTIHAYGQEMKIKETFQRFQLLEAVITIIHNPNISSNMSYLRLKNVTLGYTLPKQLTQKASIQTLRLYVSANNLFLLHKGQWEPTIRPRNQYR